MFSDSILNESKDFQILGSHIFRFFLFFKQTRRLRKMDPYRFAMIKFAAEISPMFFVGKQFIIFTFHLEIRNST